jgi:hypothetical protein
VSVTVRFQDSLRKYVTPWLSERLGFGRKPDKVKGFGFLWGMIQPLDVAAEVLLQGLRARLPGIGTPTALPLTGRSRGMVRAQNETHAEYGARLTTWIDRARILGSQRAIAISVHEYMASRPRVRVVNRAGHWTTVDTDGTITTHDAATPFTWDTISHPERSGHWWDQWVIVYVTSQWPKATTYGPAGRKTGYGHLCSREEYDAIRGEILQHKSMHSYVRAVVWTTDAALFDPANPATWPNGEWGAWGTRGSGSRVMSSRNHNTCRFWEF